MGKNILDVIAASKRKEVESMKKLLPFAELRALVETCERVPVSMTESIRCRDIAVIAEHKRRSPSKGEIAPMSSVATVAESYAVNGAAAMSVLTDTPFFGGSLDDLAVARATAPWLPILRKEFIVDEYQIYQARLFGADAILLIASMIPAASIERFNRIAHSLGLQTLVEIHSEEEAAAVPEDADMAGINNRDLTTFVTDTANCRKLIGTLPENMVKVAESGIKSPEDLLGLKEAGFDAFLIGEALMKEKNPGERLFEFLSYGSR